MITTFPSYYLEPLVSVRNFSVWQLGKVKYFVCVWSYTSLSCITGPEWASYTLGVFVCHSCSGLHRNIAQISKVKSLILDPWTPSELEVRNPVGDPLVSGDQQSGLKSHLHPSLSSIYEQLSFCLPHFPLHLCLKK